MSAINARILVPVFLALVAGGVWGYWLASSSKGIVITERREGQDGGGEEQIAAIDLKGKFEKSESPSPVTAIPGSWPQVRGPKRDGVNTETRSLLHKLDKAGPAKLWTAKLGEGYAGPVVHNGRVYLLDHEEGKGDVLRCWSLGDGQELWRRSYDVEVTRNHGMSRTTPAVTDKYIVTLGPRCHVLCCDPVTGDYKWGIDLQRDYGTVEPEWYAGQCPLIDGDKAIIAPGGSSVLMMAVDCATGQVVWKTSNPRKWKMTHSSITPMTFKGKRTYVYCAGGGVVGVSAEDGALLWETNAWKMQTCVPSPVVIDDSRILLAAGYGKGAMLLQLKEEGGKVVPSIVWTKEPRELGAEQQTPIAYKGNIYGVIPGGQLVCINPEGKTLWNSGKTRFGLGSYLIGDGMIISMNDTGTLSLAEATAEGYRPIASADVFEEGAETWGPMALVNGRLLVRDSAHLICLDMRSQPND